MATSEQAVRDGLAAFLLAGIIREVDAPTRLVYVRGLKDVAPDVILLATERLLTTPRRFPLTLPEWVETCAAVVEDRRKSAARQAKALTEDCPDCQGSGWSNAEGPNAVIRCTCAKRALALIEEAGRPVMRALLPHEDYE
jgi:hypothetical protein